MSQYRVPTWSVWAALFSVYLIWGSTYLGIRIAIETVPPFLMAASRFLVAGGLLYLWRRGRGDPAPTAAEWRSAAVVGLCLMAVGNGAVVWAEQRVPSGLTALLIGMTPLWFMVLDWVKPLDRLRGRSGGARPARRGLLGLAIGLIGMAVLVGPSSLGGSSVDPLGAAAVLVGTLFWAGGSLYSRTARLPKSPLLGTSMEMLTGAGALLVMSLLFGDWGRLNLAAISARSLTSLLYLTFVGSLVAFSAYIWLLRVAPTSLVATYAYVNPVVALLLGNLIAAEPITPRALLAAVIILSGVVLITTAPASQMQPAPGSQSAPVAGGE